MRLIINIAHLLNTVSFNLKLATRNIIKHRTQSTISIIGLGIGLGCVLQLSFIIIHEYSFDSYIPEGKNAYRVLHGSDTRTPFPLAEAAFAEIPAIKNFFRYYQTNSIELKSRNNEITLESNFAFADETIFDCLGIRVISGKPTDNQTDIAISEEMAEKHFGSNSPLGESMLFNIGSNYKLLTISGVYKNFPSNSSIAPNFIAHITLTNEFLRQAGHTLGQYNNRPDESFSWDRFEFGTYIILSANSDPIEVTQYLQKYSENITDDSKREYKFSLQPTKDIYLKSNELGGNWWVRQGNAQELIYYIAIAIFILLIAILNYVLLTKARFLSRLKEFGTQKVLGANQHSVLRKVVFESMLIVLVGLIPAILITFGNIPYISNPLERTIDSSVFFNLTTWLVVLFIVLITGTASGWVIGRSITRTSTVILLKGISGLNRSKQKLNNSFLALHFTIFIILMVGAITVNKQIDYALSNFKSIDPTNIIICELNTTELYSQFNIIDDEIHRLPGVIQTAGSTFIPPFNAFLPIKLANEDEIIQFDGLIMGKGMIELLGMEMAEGEPFGDFSTSNVEVIFNESAAHAYSIKAGEYFNAFYVKGIVKDFNAHSLHTAIQPMVILQQHPNKMRLLAIKTDGVNDATILSTINELLSNMAPDNIISTYYLADQIAGFYGREQQQARIMESFVFLAVILAIMGLLGMTLTTTTQRTKEVGIRKVYGARVWEVIALLNLKYAKVLGRAFIISTPIAWYAMNKWLQNFAYHTELNWWIFGLAGLTALGVMLLTVSWHSWKAAVRNPVETLRYE